MPEYSLPSGHHFIVAAIPESNMPDISQCAIDLGVSGLWNISNKQRTAIRRQCPLPGIQIEYFMWLVNMLNFTFELRIPPTGTYGKPFENGTWDGVIGMLARNEADFSFHFFFMTFERFRVVEFGAVAGDIPRYGFLYKNPNPISPFSMFYPLNWEIYTTIVGCFILTFSAAFLVTKSNPGPSRRDDISMIIQIIWRMLEIDTLSLKRRFDFKIGIILLSWFLATYTLINAYKSNLTASTITKSGELPLKNIDQAVQLLKSGQLHLVVPKENFAEFYNVLEGLPSVSTEYEIWARLLQNYTPTVVNDTVQLVDYLAKPGYAYFGDVRLVMWKLSRNRSPKITNLDLVYVETGKGVLAASLAFRRGFPFMPIFRIAMATMLSETVIRNKVKRYFPFKYQNLARDETAQPENRKEWVLNSKPIKDAVACGISQALDMVRLMDVFTLWTVGCGLATLVFIGERLVPILYSIRTRRTYILQ